MCREEWQYSGRSYLRKCELGRKLSEGRGGERRDLLALPAKGKGCMSTDLRKADRPGNFKCACWDLTGNHCLMRLGKAKDIAAAP